MPANADELRGMRRVVEYLRDRAKRLHEAADRCAPDSEVGRVARIKALGLNEAAAMVEEGIELNGAAPPPNPKREAVWHGIETLVEALTPKEES